MKVAVVIPWRPHPTRMEHFRNVTNWLSADFPDWPVVLSDTNAQPFNRAAARNAGVQAADAFDVVVMLDADTIVESRALRDAADLAILGMIVLPYDEYYVVKGKAKPKLVPSAISGAAVMTPAAWWQGGGQDERFKGWGYEDTAWKIAMDALVGVVRVVGTAYAGAHPTADRGGMHTRMNRTRCLEYSRLRGDEEALRQYVRDPARFAVTGLVDARVGVELPDQLAHLAGGEGAIRRGYPVVGDESTEPNLDVGARDSRLIRDGSTDSALPGLGDPQLP